MENSKVVNTPLAQHFKLASAQSPFEKDEIESMKFVPYANLVGSLMYEMISY